ncbi:hypothetical protein BC940DRAFT_309834 [Gongronella butleri]|nr:hypothetical protein BC940DRAFT_309834 [Gongronella butleri]
MDTEFESVLLVIRECFVYKIPPRTAARGYRAGEWGDLATSFAWKGRLRIIGKGSACIIRLEDGETGDIFAECPYDPASNSVEGVLDSSRYFVLKVESEGRRAFIGMGFQERSDAFDFNVALQDHAKHLRAEKEAERRQAEPKVDNTPKKDYSLKDGQTISISIGNMGKRSRPRPTDTQTTGSSGLVPLLPPPPSAAQVKQQQQQQQLYQTPSSAPQQQRSNTDLLFDL